MVIVTPTFNWHIMQHHMEVHSICSYHLSVATGLTYPTIAMTQKRLLSVLDDELKDPEPIPFLKNHNKEELSKILDLHMSNI
jgi:hypothetical protein